MKEIDRISVPTGDIVIAEGEGKLEFLSIGDYGKDVNLKADFLELTRKPERVCHTELLPLTEKWVITISTQYGCSMGCTFCDVPKVGPGRNIKIAQLAGQILHGLNLHPEITWSNRLNIHFARMGEPTWNPDVLDCAKWLKEHIDPEYNVHPVVSTMMPSGNVWLKTFIHTWMRIKNRLYRGNAGLQISVNSTDEFERSEMFKGNALRLAEISNVMQGIIPSGRKITLNFALADWEIDPRVLLDFFPPEYYLIKLTPMHKTAAAIKGGIMTAGDCTEYYPYEEHETALRDAGYDVLVFIASKEEDESRITCGNALLASNWQAMK